MAEFLKDLPVYLNTASFVAISEPYPAVSFADVTATG